MDNERKNVLGTLFTVFLFVGSLFASFVQVAPYVAASNGLGEVTYLEVDGTVSKITEGVQTVDTSKEHVYRIHNDDPLADQGGHCIDEIIIKYPNTWQGRIDLNDVTVTNLGDVVLSNENDDGTFSGLVADNLSLRIVPDQNTNGVKLCPSGTTEITIDAGDLYSPVNPEDSTITIYTSDEDHNEPSGSHVREILTNTLPIIHVTDADRAIVLYMDIKDNELKPGAGGADYMFLGTAKGAWARLNELYLEGTVATTVDVYMDDGDGAFDAGDRKIATAAAVGTAPTSVVLGNYAGFDIVGVVEEGFLKDNNQDVNVKDHKYWIKITGAASTLTLRGHADEDADQTIDPTYTGTGYTNPPKEGTVINVEKTMQRQIHMQLVDNSSGLALYVLDDGISLYYTTTLSTFKDASPRKSDNDGQVEIYLLPGTVAGNALIEICFPDVYCVEEDVAISPGVAVRKEITAGMDTTVEAGSVENIEVTIYDQYGNVISNNPDSPMVTYTIISAPDTDADLDDDTTPPFAGDGDGFEQENADLGFSSAALQTSATIGENVVEVCVLDPVNDCMTTTITGVLGQGDRVECTLLDDQGEPIDPHEVTADQCFQVLVQVMDKHGNVLPKWESLVEVSLKDLDNNPHGETKLIVGSDLREEMIQDYGKLVKGKLNNDEEGAWAIVEVCGCEALGQFQVDCRSDTLDDDWFEVDVINSDPTCIDVRVGDDFACNDDLFLDTSIVDTCWNKVEDQECTEGGFAASCVRLETTCGELSTDKTCVDLGNTGMAPTVDLDISACGCGEIEITATDEPDCCPSVYAGTLPMCDMDGDGEPDEVIINKIGPADHINMSIYPKADNQDDFWVSEKTVVDLTLLDACEQYAVCDDPYVDLELTGEDCLDDTIQVDSPFIIDNGFCVESEAIPGSFECARHQAKGTCESFKECEWIPESICSFEDEPVHKVVIENCAIGDKWKGNKEWTDLPEKDDIVVDKIAFEYNGNSTNVEVCVYEESEETAGYQPGEDILWNCMTLATVPKVPFNDFDNYPEEGAYDQLHDSPLDTRDGVGDVYLIELDDRISKYNGNNEYDNQRLGGAIVEPGDTKDFYIVLSSFGPVQCGSYDADYLYMQDYNSPDIITWWPDFRYDTHVRDTLEGSEEYTRRNDDYTGSDPYPSTRPATPDYGFGDRILHNLMFDGGHAKVFFRDLVAETVNVFVDADFPVIFMPNEYPAEADTQAELTFLPQPATQVVARNHGDLTFDPFICDDAGFEPTYEYDRDGFQIVTFEEGSERECRPAMACEGEGYDINLQVTDGFQNRVGLETEVQLHSCLTFPHYIYLGDTILPIDENITVDLWDYFNLHDQSSDPWDACFDMGKFRSALRNILGEHLTDDSMHRAFLDSPEFAEFVESVFEDKDVYFQEHEDYPLGVDAAGHTIVTTDADGKAIVRVESRDSSFAQIRSFDASFRIFTVPHALDADFFDVAFMPGLPGEWDVIAVPEHGTPADGEQEARLLIRKTDNCQNPVVVNEAVTVTAISDSGRAVISKDFNGKNNYDNQVTGYLKDWSCKFLFPWFEDCSLTVLNDVIEDVHVTVEDAFCEETGEGFCSGPQDFGCETFPTEQECNEIAELCEWVPGVICQQSDTAWLEFVGAPVKLNITEIKHSDLLPADGWKLRELRQGRFDLPRDACTRDQLLDCSLHGEPEICFKQCVEYGNTGGWVTVQIQDKFGDRVTGYLGDGFKRDPGDVKGKPDNLAEKICVALDDPRAFVSDSTFGWVDLDLRAVGQQGRIYCGDLAFGQGSFKVDYHMLDHDGQPLDPRETRKVIVSVFDVCDRELFEYYGGNWKEERWDDLCNAQEYNENNLPDSETASRLDPTSNKMIFVAVPDRWDIKTDKVELPADGKDYATLTINTESEYMDVRTSLDATVQSSLLGSTLESHAITPGCYVEGISDPVNPTSINVLTEACSGGQAELMLSSVEPGTARVTVTGNGFGCKEFITGFEYREWFEEWVEFDFGEGDLEGEWFANYTEQCIGAEYGESNWTETCFGEVHLEEEFQEHCIGSGTNTFGLDIDFDLFSGLDIDFSWTEEYEEFCTGILTSWANTTNQCFGYSAWYSVNGEFCQGFEQASYDEVWTYFEFSYGALWGDSVQANTELYTPYCIDWGVIPLTPKSLDIEFKQSYQEKIVLEEGWNFFSVPKELDPSNDEWAELNLHNVCSASAMWDEASQSWVMPVPGTTKLLPMEGFWCFAPFATVIMTEPLDTSGGVFLPPTKDIFAGWNDVGLSSNVERKIEHALISIDAVYTQILDWLESLQRYEPFSNTGELGGGTSPGTTGTNNMEAGEAYFLWATGTGDLAGLS